MTLHDPRPDDPVDVLIVAANARSLHANRGDLILAMKERGLRVAAAVPKRDYLPVVEQLGIDIETFDLHRTGTNPFRDGGSFAALRAIMVKHRPKKVFCYGLKPIGYGVLAARLAGVRECYAMITGLGHLFTTGGLKNRVLKQGARALYAVSLSQCRTVFFQNRDDLRELAACLPFVPRRRFHLTAGSGVNLERFAPQPGLPERPTFLFVGRLLREKGIAEFVAAARLVRARQRDARFVAVGPLDTSLPHSISEQDLRRWTEAGDVEFVGHAKDVRGWLSAASAIVLPSYREGTPRAVLEAMSVGRAVITTDAPGCRETTIEGVNGLLVPVRDSRALADAMATLASDRAMLERMGRASRQLVEERFDVRKVNAAILAQMGYQDG